jgi:glycosyltransferase involved in cell wall biosynthesis
MVRLLKEYWIQYCIMNNKPLVSIILPTYNGARYVRYAIESCLNQNYDNIELIIVNDASTDSTPLILEEYRRSDPRVKIITNKINKKLPESLNIGHRAASGEYQTWTSDDNLYTVEAINVMLDYLIRNPKLDIVYTNYIEVDENNTTIRIVTMPDYYNLVEGNCIGACFLYKKMVFEKLNGYDNYLFLAEDYDFWIRASEFFKIDHLNVSPYRYRLQPNSLTESYKEKIKKNAVLTQVKNLKIFSTYPVPFKTRLYAKLSYYFGRQGDYQKSRQFYSLLLLNGFGPFINHVKHSKRIFFNSILPLRNHKISI